MRASAALIAFGAWSCASPPPPPPPPPAPLATPPPATVSAPPPAASAEPPLAQDRCPPLAADEISDEETPAVAGAPKTTPAGEWLEARGVTRAAFGSWLRAHDPKNLQDFDVDSVFGNPCQTLTVGDKSEEALVCTVAIRTSIMRFSAYAFVVRNKRIVPVLEVGYALPAMDWPDTRWLDLQVAFAPDGLAVDVHDRAKPGTVLVPPPSFCHEWFARYLACEKAHRAGAPLEDVCPREMDRDHKTTFGHYSPLPPESMSVHGRVVLNGCDAALPKLDQLVKQSPPGDTFGPEFRGDRAFAVTSCKARGHYVWKGDRFVRSP